MSNICMLTGRSMGFGNNVSHSNRKTKRTFKANIHKHRVWVQSEKKWVTLTLSARGLKTVDVIGVDDAMARIRANGHKI